MKINYQGAFVNEKLEGNLYKTIEHQHVTMIPPNKDMMLPEELLGKCFELVVDGYANDGQNEGYRVQLPEELQAYYINDNVPHITVSVAEGAKPINTGHLIFDDLRHPFIVTARVGVFAKGRPIFEKIS